MYQPRQPIHQTDPPRPPRETLPTMYDLPTGNPGENLEEPGLPDDFHAIQPKLLRETFRPVGYSADQYYSAMDLNLYYDRDNTHWYKRPDWFAAVGVPPLYEGRELRMSYVTWQEPANPYIVVELISPGTEKEDLGQILREVGKPLPKWQVYEQALRVPYYLVFDRYKDQLRFFKLNGAHYQEQQSEAHRFLIPELEIGIGLWHGTFDGIEYDWLRWFDREGDWIPTPAELERSRAEVASQAAALAQQAAASARQAAAAERQKADKLMAQLRALGVEPEV